MLMYDDVSARVYTSDDDGNRRIQIIRMSAGIISQASVGMSDDAMPSMRPSVK